MDALVRTPAGTAVFGFMPVVPMTIISGLLMILVSLATRPPSGETVGKYFD
ncbi:MAG: hypothetical protein IPG76_15075 [Acidobacteria bacterium]|nr:hypothetical protein [Acidobacteriota bacterium]